MMNDLIVNTSFISTSLTTPSPGSIMAFNENNRQVDSVLVNHLLMNHHFLHESCQISSNSNTKFRAETTYTHSQTHFRKVFITIHGFYEHEHKCVFAS